MSVTSQQLQTRVTISTVLETRHIRYALIVIWGIGLVPLVGLPTAMTWFALTLAAGHARTLAEKHLFTKERIAAFDARFLAVAILTGCFWASAPLLAWFSGHPAGEAVAMLYLASGATLVAGQLIGEPRIFATMCAPYIIAALIMVVDSRGEGSAALAAAILVFAAALAAGSNFAVQRKRQMAEAQDRNTLLVEQLRLAVDAISAAPWDMDFRTLTLRGGEEMGKIYGRPLTWDDVKIAGTSMAHPDDQAHVAAAIAALSPEQPRGISDHRIIREDGAVVWLRTAAIVSYDENGVMVRMSGLTHDISAQKRLEIEVLDATRAAEAALRDKRQMFTALSQQQLDAPAPETPGDEFSLTSSVTRLRAIVEEIAARDAALMGMIDALDKARASAESANLAKSQFLANMSHELRTPLNAIIGYGELQLELAQTRGDADDEKDLGRILAAAKLLLHLVNDVLDLSKIEAGRMDVLPDTFRVDTMLDEVAATVTPMAAANGNMVRVTLNEDIGEAFTDRFKLAQCVLNLASNAVKFTRDGEICISADRERRADVDWLVISIADQGVGIAPENLQQLFQPFVQADASVTRAYGGTGLGLAITRHIARLLGGDVSVQSAPGLGSTFTLSVPAAYRAPRFEAAA